MVGEARIKEMTVYGVESGEREALRLLIGETRVVSANRAPVISHSDLVLEFCWPGNHWN